ncbi:MAG: hypothetical protein ABIJ18_01460 [archaeon]
MPKGKLVCESCGSKKLFKGRLCEDCWYKGERKRIKALRSWENSTLNLKDKNDPIFNPKL